MVFENKVFWESHCGAVFSDLHFMNREKYFFLCPGFLVSKQELVIFPLAMVRVCFWLVKEAFVILKPRNGRHHSPFPFFTRNTQPQEFYFKIFSLESHQTR